MTILVHGAVPASITLMLLRGIRFKWWIVGAVFLLGAAPDIGGITAWISGDWSFYNTLHRPDLPMWAFVLLWPYTLHLIIDGFVHIPDPNWVRLYWWVEILLWFIAALFTWLGLRNEDV